jgi:hypothetical protein
MITIKEEPLTEEFQLLNEMASVCQKADGYDMIIEVYARDHGLMGNKTRPAHAHVKSLSGEYQGKFAITKEPPSSGYYVIDCDKKKEIPAFYKSKIAGWAKARDKETGSLNWKILIKFWNGLHPQR